MQQAQYRWGGWIWKPPGAMTHANLTEPSSWGRTGVALMRPCFPTARGERTFCTRPRCDQHSARPLRIQTTPCTNSSKINCWAEPDKAGQLGRNACGERCPCKGTTAACAVAALRSCSCAGKSPKLSRIRSEVSTSEFLREREWVREEDHHTSQEQVDSSD